MPDRSPDYIIIVVYLGLIAFIGIISGGKQKSIKDYFLGSANVPWWAVCFSIVAAETSTLTFISIPGLAYISNLNFLQLAFGFLLGRIIIALFFLPAYFRGELKTAYTFLEHRFGSKARTYASVVFLFTRTAADGVRLFATAIPLYLMLDIEPFFAILIIALVSLIYTYTGGLRGVIWVDVIQMFIYLGGAVIAGVFILHNLPDGIDSAISIAVTENKFSLINLNFNQGLKDFFSEPYTLFSGLIGGAFLSMASHGTDQLIVQRLLAAGNISGGRKALVGSGVIVIIQFAVFLLLGLLLYAYYGNLDVKSDEIFPMFIIKQLPIGVSGIIIAGLFAAAMSTIAGSISSLSSSTMHDLYIPLTGKKKDEKNLLAISRTFTVFWTAMLTLSALFFMNSSKAVVELALSIASFTYGGLLGTFILGIINHKADQRISIIAFSAGITGMIIVVITKLTAWTWYTLIGVIITLAVGYLLTLILKSEK